MILVLVGFYFLGTRVDVKICILKYGNKSVHQLIFCIRRRNATDRDSDGKREAGEIHLTISDFVKCVKHLLI